MHAKMSNDLENQDSVWLVPFHGMEFRYKNGLNCRIVFGAGDFCSNFGMTEALLFNRDPQNPEVFDFTCPDAEVWVYNRRTGEFFDTTKFPRLEFEGTIQTAPRTLVGLHDFESDGRTMPVWAGIKAYDAICIAEKALLMEAAEFVPLDNPEVKVVLPTAETLALQGQDAAGVIAKMKARHKVA